MEYTNRIFQIEIWIILYDTGYQVLGLVESSERNENESLEKISYYFSLDTGQVHLIFCVHSIFGIKRSFDPHQQGFLRCYAIIFPVLFWHHSSPTLFDHAFYSLQLGSNKLHFQAFGMVVLFKFAFRSKTRSKQQNQFQISLKSAIDYNKRMKDLLLNLKKLPFK